MSAACTKLGAGLDLLVTGRAFHRSGCWSLLRGAAVRTELRADWILGSAFRARGGLSLSRTRALSVLSTDRSGHHLPVAHSQPETHTLSRRAALLLSGVLNRLRGFELHVSVHIADRSHARALVDHLLNFFRRGDGRDDQIDKLEPLLRKVIGDSSFYSNRKLIVVSWKIENRLQVFAEQIVEPRYEELFALVRDEAGHAVHAAVAIGPGARLELEFSDGRVGATADSDRPAATRPAKPVASEPKTAAPKRVVKPVGQGSLF